MAKRITTGDRRFLKKVDCRLAKGWTWQEIADDLRIPLSTCYMKHERLLGRIAQESLKMLDTPVMEYTR